MPVTHITFILEMASNDVTELYITIPNWTSSNYFSHNSIGEFRVQLPHSLDLKGLWSVGLSQILYNYTWYNIEQNRNKIYITINKKNSVVVIPEGFYTDKSNLIHQINTNIDHILGNIRPKFGINSYTGKCRVILPQHCTVQFSEDLSLLLGFKTNDIHKSSDADFAINLKHKTEAVYIYCDIIEDQIVGEEKWRLERLLVVIVFALDMTMGMQTGCAKI